MGNSNDGGKLIGAILLGITIGGALGILFAPDKGSETRKKISSKSGDLSDTIKDKFGKFVDKFKKEIEDAADEANSLKVRGESVIDSL